VLKTKHVPDAKKQEQRRRMLKLREAEAQRSTNHAEAELLFFDAQDAYHAGDITGAVRFARKAIQLYPGYDRCLVFLGGLHLEARQFADALHYLHQARKLLPETPWIIYECAMSHSGLQQDADALRDFESFLEVTESLPKAEWRSLRREVQLHVALLHEKLAIAQAGQTKTVSPLTTTAPAPPTPPAPTPTRETRRVTIEFLPSSQPELRNESVGSLADYLLVHRLHELRQAQSFEDLICLPTLNGVDTYIYQHDTVRKVLRQFKGRALLADEVGLGKTIEACLVLKEYWMRGMVRKVLILTPPALVSQWRGELQEKFDLAAASPDSAEYRRDPEQFWKREPLIVASIAMARMETNAQAIAGIAWDMVIVDEAHSLKNRTSANWKLVNSLTKKFILMLTATPVENNLLELYNLITVLKPGLLATEAEFKKLFVLPGKPKAPKNPERLHELLKEVMIRNTRAVADVRLPHRVATSIVVQPATAEAELYALVTSFVQRNYKNGERPSLAFEWLQRHAGSSPHSLKQAVGRTLAEDRAMASGVNRKTLEGIHEAASAIHDSGKGLRLGEMLTSHGGKSVVFTDFVQTLEYLERICHRHGLRFATFRGDMPRADKDAAIARFRDEAAILLSTGAGGEGRNLQFANTVINFDLPWNPMRLEQRVGRVHRIGQTQDVFVFNFCQQGSLEEQLLRVLHDKINMFELVVGEMDAILGAADDSQDFADLVLELWLSHDQADLREKAFDELAERLIAGKKHHLETKRLEDELFQREFEV
jgi:superfamily II DNA or RNA helicase